MARRDFSDIPIKLTKDELVAQLTDLIPRCVARDQRVDRAHKAEEKINWQLWKKQTSEWGKKYGSITLEAFKRLRSTPTAPYLKRVECPDALAPLARRLLKEVQMSNQQVYTITSDNNFWRLHEILTLDLPKPKSVC